MRTGKATHVHLLQILRLEYGDGQLAGGRNVTKRKANIAQFVFLHKGEREPVVEANEDGRRPLTASLSPGGGDKSLISRMTFPRSTLLSGIDTSPI